MTASRERWTEIERLLDRALDTAPEGRPAFLARACPDDPVLRAEVERLLRAAGAAEKADGFLDEPAAAWASPLLSWGAGHEPLAEHQTLEAGSRVGAYEVRRRLGRGGMATVYLAHDEKHHRDVAIKVLHPELAVAVGTGRFLREIETVARLAHPHILPLYDSGTVASSSGAVVPWFVMPCMEGESLRDRLERERRLPLEVALRITREVAGALDYAHRHGVVHRDVKPGNILFEAGHAVVSDFGIAGALEAAGGEGIDETGLVLGTPAYMSPEQAEKHGRVDGRADVYALGCVIHEMLAGEPPFGGATAQAVLLRHAADQPAPLRTLRPDVPPGVEEAIGRALRKVPAERFGTAGELAAALDAAARMAPAPAASRIPRVHRGRIALAAAAALVAATAGYLAMRPAEAPATSPALVAVLPFRTSGARPELAWLRDGMVDLLTIKLASDDGLRAVESGALLSAWHQAEGSKGGDVAPAVALAVARGLGAGSVVDGGVVGTPQHLILTATLRPSGGRRRGAGSASVEGPVESLTVLVDRLAARLLGLEAGTEAGRLASLTSTSLPAIRAYLAGRAAFREGRFEDAFDRFREATVLDSTFALAALELVHAASWTAPAGADAERARALARAGRARLEPGDQALVDVWTDPLVDRIEHSRRWRAATEAYPDRAEIWYGAGDAYYHYGGLAGLRDPSSAAAEAFRRGWALDSAHVDADSAAARSPILVEPLNHLVEMAQVAGDVAAVQRLVALGLAADSSSARGGYLRWHRALALGDSALRAYWADSVRLHVLTVSSIYRFTASSGIGMRDYRRAADLMFPQWEAASHDQGSFHRSMLDLNGGRPGAAARRLRGLLDAPGVSLGLPIRTALYWGGDTSAAADAARRLVPIAAPAAVRGQALQEQLQSLCALATWRLAHGDERYAETAVRRLRRAAVVGLPRDDSVAVAGYKALCAALLEASRATALRLPDARVALERADSAALRYNVGESMGANLIVARLAEAQGDFPLALRAVRRRASAYDLLPLWYLSSFLREEGRLAALAGDTAGAVRAYRHYLAMRPEPEPAMRAEVERVRSELARLTPEHRRP